MLAGSTDVATPVTARQLALAALLEQSPVLKVAAVRALAEECRAGRLALGATSPLAALPDQPGRPATPLLVSPRQLAPRGVGSRAGHAALLHAIAHIEFNAINLALDAAARFDNMPAGYYEDWLAVAAEEAVHFGLLCEHLASLGVSYGDFPAHDGLWEMVWRTRDDVLARMALVPRTLEARGLDASPPIRDRLRAAGDMRGAEILEIILRDEIGHVRIGNHWFRWLCAQRGETPYAAFARVAAAHGVPRLKGPFNLAARRAAGFDERELAALTGSRDAPGPSAVLPPNLGADASPDLAERPSLG
ncbi:MAG: ferritin-like domain-containing protein [Janthinobacterium lividum]